jgi:antitoxin component YwqK of YwqJK toxin-antitoxin module
VVGGAPLTKGGVHALAVALAALPSMALAGPKLVAEGGCRDGVANGAFVLRADDGRPRVAGAFAKGARTGTFLFWSEAGARIALIPYDGDRKAGTVAVWFPPANRGGDVARKSESGWVDDRRHGETRSWYRDGRRRTELRYEHGRLVEAEAWSAAGAALTEEEARRQAAQDEATDRAFYATLEAFLDTHRPECK